MTTLNYNPIGTPKIYHIYEYYEIPIVFSFYSNTGTLFLANWVDYDDEQNYNTWIYMPITYKRLLEIENGNISLRTAIENQEGEFVYKVFDYGDSEQFEMISSSSISSEYLPDEDSYVEYNNPQSILTNNIEILENHVTNSNRYIIDLSFEPNSTHDEEVSADFLGNTLIDFQQLLNSLSLDRDATINSKFSPEIKAENKVKVTNTFAASFGIRLESERIANILGDDQVGKSASYVLELLLNIDNLEQMKILLENMNKKSIYKFNSFLSNLNENKMSGKMKIALPKSGTDVEVREGKFKEEHIGKFISDLKNNISEEEHIIEKEGILAAFNSQNQRFKFIAEEDTYSGKIDINIENESFQIPSIGTARILEKIKTNDYTRESNVTHKLMSWS